MNKTSKDYSNKLTICENKIYKKFGLKHQNEKIVLEKITAVAKKKTNLEVNSRII